MTERPPNTQLYSELKGLIEAETFKETECKQYLQWAWFLLCDRTASSLVSGITEYRGHCGDSDYILVVDEDDGATKRRCAYIWEVKAPQAHLFEKDTNNRLRPSNYLVKAENQLLNYYHEIKQSGTFCSEFGVQPDQIYFGGIVIGCRKQRVKEQFCNEQELDKAFARALDLRKRYFWECSKINLIVWDRILEVLHPRNVVKYRDFIESREIHIDGRMPHTATYDISKF